MIRRSWRKRIIEATPMICLITYLAIGFFAHVWHPTWVIFFLIIAMPIILYGDWARITYPIVCAVAYVILSLFTGLWHPLWLIFLTIPVFYTLFGPYIYKNRNRIKVEKDKDGDSTIIID